MRVVGVLRRPTKRGISRSSCRNDWDIELLLCGWLNQTGMDFKNRLKGSVTQTLVKALLEDARYRTIPLGVEEVIREVSVLSQRDYSDLELPEVLRKMPDFFVADKDISKAWLVEVKYRKVWNDEARRKLGKQILEQVKVWNPLFLTVFLGNSVRPGNNNPVHSIGVIKLTCERGKIVFITPDEIGRAHV